ncbi:MAG TPA: GNAT family N-acetyltransferase, partial [Elusimicrobiota bacterium]|nr:GNAT family N-acetyltransferase [Elusimicrobiota bacterium]
PLDIRPATREDVPAVIDLLYRRPPCAWMKNLSTPSLAVFLRYAVGESRAVLPLARADGERAPAGYALAIPDPGAFWLGFALENPVIAQTIWFFRRRRAAELRRELAGGARPEFSWAPPARARARILGLYVRLEHRERGVARALYADMFARLKARGITLVEEHVSPDYPLAAGRFPGGFGWRLEACGCGGRKVSKSL